MAKSNKPDITEILLKGAKRSVKRAIDIASRTNTSMIVQKGDKIVAVKPKYKYVRVPVKTAKKKVNLKPRKKAKSKT
jgi:hypothetical protein